MRNRSAGGTSRVGVAAAAALAVAGLVGASAWAVASTRHPASAAATSGSVWVTPAAASDGSDGSADPGPAPSGPDAQLAARIAAGMMTAPGSATWVRAKGRAAMRALFPGEPQLLGDGQAAVDVADVLVVFTDEHVNGVHSVPAGVVSGPPRAAAALVDAATGRSISGSLWEGATGGGTGRDDSRAVDPVGQWRLAMARLGTVHRVRVER